MIVGALAFFLDCFIGDPNSKFHPVVLIGNLISATEKLLYGENASDRSRFFRGTLLVFIVLTLSYGVTWAIMYGIALLGNEYISLFVAALILKSTISPRSLAKAGREIYDYLRDNDLSEARRKVGWIVGRDTDKLTVPEIVRATVETISENIVDGIISPLFFFALGGVPLAMLYRAANTMDSMIGYKNDKYIFFGRFAARLDDVLNYIPARLTGMLIVVASFVLHYDFVRAWKMMMRDADKHPSPNGGYCEATVAGALGIRLGGLNYYFGMPHFRAYMGEPICELTPRHIIEATKIMYTVTVMFLCILLCI